jgi:hypothetical protein
MLACDCSFVAMSMRGAVPESVGAKVRTITPAMRRKLRKRDRGCRWPGCTEERFVDAHHIVFWGDGGLTILSNLVLLCRHHHRGIHTRGCSIEVMGDGRFVFRLADGSVVEDRVPRPPVPGGGAALVDSNDQLGLAIDDETSVPGWAGERLDLADAVTGVLCHVMGPAWVMGHREDTVDAFS